MPSAAMLFLDRVEVNWGGMPAELTEPSALVRLFACSGTACEALALPAR